MNPSFEARGFDAAQAQFHRRWQHLHDPDVRALAWLLDSPDLFDADAPQWQAKVARLTDLANLTSSDNLAQWLQQQDDDPAPLKQDLQPTMRLGRYAEKLMGFYLQQQGVLVAQNLPVRAAKNDTIGEFDFLLRDGPLLVHWEFATKFYLYEASIGAADNGYFVGPNLADSLDLKMGKILHRQLALGQHPAAQALLPQAIDRAQALVKGWLFYRDSAGLAGAGLSPQHCRGFWCPLEQADLLSGDGFALLPRRRWLAPAELSMQEAMSKAALLPALEAHFNHDPNNTQLNTQPVMVVCLQAVGNVLLEARRGFVVPNDWQQRAVQRYPVLSAASSASASEPLL
jgi:hypothetical protein